MKAYERLLKYVVVRTPSDENSDTVPSSTCQFDLARILETEMKELEKATFSEDENIRQVVKKLVPEYTIQQINN